MVYKHMSSRLFYIERTPVIVWMSIKYPSMAYPVAAVIGDFRQKGFRDKELMGCAHVGIISYNMLELKYNVLCYWAIKYGNKNSGGQGF